MFHVEIGGQEASGDLDLVAQVVQDLSVVVLLALAHGRQLHQPVPDLAELGSGCTVGLFLFSVPAIFNLTVFRFCGSNVTTVKTQC